MSAPAATSAAGFVTGAPLLSLRGVGRGYASAAGHTQVLSGIDLDIRAGEFVAIVGQSGSGKSTLLNILGLLDRPDAGAYRLAGRDVGTLGEDARAELRRRTFGFVFQRYHLLPGASARANAELPSLYAGARPADRRRRAAALLDRLGLAGLGERRPAALSGGQQQRVSIARALVNDAGVILADEPTGALDSATGAGVMALLRDLAAQGRTVILVTHDPVLAAAAPRRIEIRDGRILSDSGPATTDGAAPADAGAPVGAGGLGLRDLLGNAAAALGGHPLRTALTLSGVVIGTAAVIAMTAIGDGARARAVEQAAATGADWIVVMPDNDDPTKPGGRLTLADADALADLPNVARVSPGRYTTVTVTDGAVSLRTEAFATSADFPEVMNWRAARGGFFTTEDARAAAPVVALGATVAARLAVEGGGDPLGRYVLVNNVPFLVTGALEPKGPDEAGFDRDDRVVVPFLTGAARLSGNPDPGGIQVAVADMARMEETLAAVRETLLARHRTEDFFVFDMAAQIAALEETRSAMSALLGLVAAISLLVGGVGVMNVMVMSVTERIREIGLRKAVGARARDIQRQFLAEAALISGAGGIVGLAIGLAIGVVATAFGAPVIFGARAVLAALAASIGLGLVFGYLPARRAARLDPVLALARD